MYAALWAMALAGVLPLILAVALLIHQARELATGQRQALALAVAQSTMQRVDADLLAARGALQALALSPQFESRDWSGLRQHARQLARSYQAERILIDDDSGRTLADTQDDTALAEVVPDADARVQVLLPVHEGHLRLRLILPLTREGLLHREPGGPDADWWMGVFDDQGRLLAAPSAARQVTRSPLTADWRGHLNAAGLGHIDGPDGSTWHVAHSPSRAGGLSTVVAAPPAGWRDLLTTEPAALLVVGGLLLVLAIATALLIGRAIATSMHRLVVSAQSLESLGQGEPPHWPSTPLRESEAVLGALATASRLLLARTRQFDQARRDRDALAFAACRDPLTGLLHRGCFLQRLDALLAQCRDDRRGLCVLFIDLDDFKGVNDAHGHALGDALLQALAGRLQAALRPVDLIGRLGGDEFAVALADLTPAQAERTTQTLVARLGEPFALQGVPLSVSVSVGLAIFPDDGEDAASLLGAADLAMYQAKASGKNAFHRSGWGAL